MEKLAQPRMAGASQAEKILGRLKFALNIRNAYFWDNDKNNFQKTHESIIYSNSPQNNSPASKQEQADLNNNLFKETYILENNGLVILENSKMVWQSPKDWWIDNFFLADSNNDGIADINLSLWKAGNFGSSKPFWVKENDMSVKNHFFVLDFASGSVKQVWGSSNLGQPNCEFQFVDIDNDGKIDLVVIEGDYLKEPKCEGNYVAVWKWNSWGFSNEWRSEKGNFSNLEIEKIDGKSYIIVDAL
jgi:poly-gamma-glutamate synthesis protein (capsule biosynthesis protein)